MKKYFNHKIKKAVVVDSLLTIESLDIAQSFTYPTESHDFYEFVYVDSGAILCNSNGEKTELTQGDFFLIPPGRNHSYEPKPERTASIFIVCFRSSAETLSMLCGRIHLSKESKAVVYEIIKESKNAFTFPFDRKLRLLSSPMFGAQQLVEGNIEKLLISLVRSESKSNTNIKLVMNSIELESNLVNDVIAILKASLYSKISLDEISKQCFYSKTFLNGIFKKNTEHSIIQYYNLLKLEEAKRLLREGVSPSSVSHTLLYESPTYFTKVFKKHLGMTPSEYKKKLIK